MYYNCCSFQYKHKQGCVRNMVERFIAKYHKPKITDESVNTEYITRVLNSDGKQFFIRIPLKVSNEFKLKNRQAVEFKINYRTREINLRFKDEIIEKTKRKSNLKKKKV